MASTMRANGTSHGHSHHHSHLLAVIAALKPALQMALGFGLALALALIMLIATRPASAEPIPQMPMLLDTVLKLENIELLRRDDRLGIGNLIVKHPLPKKAKPGDPNYESWGSAFLVGKCHIMTARHVIDPSDPDNETNELPMKSRIEFVIGPIRDMTKVQKANDLSKLSEIMDSSMAIPVAWGQYVFPKVQNEESYRDSYWASFPEDWALLRLEKCLGDGPKGYLPLALHGITSQDLMKTAQPIPARAISGPPEAGLSHLIDDKNCFIYGQVEYPIWSNDCYGKPGSSGSPLLEPDGNGGWRVVALVTRGQFEWTLRAQLFSNSRPRGWPWRIQYMMMANPVSGFLDRVKPILAEAKDDGVRIDGAGTNKVYARKDPELVKQLAALHEANPDNVEVMVRWLIAIHMTEGPEAALTEIDRLLALKPDSRELKAVRIDVALNSKLTHNTALKKAIEDLKLFRGQFPELAELQVMQGWLTVQNEDCMNGANLLRRTWDRHGIDPSVRLDWADAMACAGQHRAALAAYDEMLMLMPKYDRPRFERAIVRFRIGQSEPAREDLRKIVAEDPKATWAQAQRAIFAFNEGHHVEEAEKDLRAAMAETREDPTFAFALGAGLLSQGRNDDAIAALTEALRNKKDDLFSSLLLHVALTKAGKKDEAKAALENLVTSHDDPNSWQIKLISLYKGEITADDYLKQIDKGPKDTRWTWMGRAHAYAGLLAYAQGNVKEARRLFSTAPFLDRTWLEYSVIDAWQRAAEG